VADRTKDLSQLARELKDRDERRARLLAKFIRAQEEERKRIARELHDETCQTVAALSLAADATLAMPPTGAPANRRDQGLAGRALSELHRVIYDLRPSVLDDLGLESAVRWYADRHLARQASRCAARSRGWTPACRRTSRRRSFASCRRRSRTSSAIPAPRAS